MVIDSKLANFYSSQVSLNEQGLPFAITIVKLIVPWNGHTLLSTNKHKIKYKVFRCMLKITFILKDRLGENE